MTSPELELYKSTLPLLFSNLLVTLPQTTIQRLRQISKSHILRGRFAKIPGKKDYFTWETANF